jgi:hypothetical protein
VLETRGKIFVMLVGDDLVLKLPKNRSTSSWTAPRAGGSIRDVFAATLRGRAALQAPFEKPTLRFVSRQVERHLEMMARGLRFLRWSSSSPSAAG